MKSKYLKTVSSLTIIQSGIYLVLCNISYAGSDAPALSLDNTNFVVSIAFVAFVALIFYLKVPSKISGLLDDRSHSIEAEINNANSILEESKTMLADLEREHKINIEKAKKILVDAEAEAKNILSEAKIEVRLNIERKVKGAGGINRSMIIKYLPGMVDPFNQSQMIAVSSRDSFSMEVLSESGMVVRNPLSCGQLIFA